MPTREDAKNALDKLIQKSRVHLYKPIQIAEILYHDRVYHDIDLAVLEDYRTKSKKWRDDICIELLGRRCTSSSRVGVTNAADRGLDMYSNWGPAIQIKHLSLDVELAKNIVGSVSSDKVIIVCKDAEKDVIVSLLTQIGWRNHIQSIVTENDLINWYEKALRGQYSELMGKILLSTLCEEIALEFPSVSTIPKSLQDRHYENISDTFWK